MIRIGLIMLLLGGLAGYGIAYARFGDANIIDELRQQYKKLTSEYETLSMKVKEITQQNQILKSKSHQLLQQNEDYSKMISQLSRYYYHLTQAAEKVSELADILGIDDEDLHHKLLSVTSEEIGLGGVTKSTESPTILANDKKFF